MSFSTDPHGPPRLVLRFAVYAGAAVLLAVIGALVLSRFNASQSAESDLSDDAAYVADELGRDDLVRVAFAGRVTDDIQAQLDDFVGPIAGARDLTRASLVSPSGTITYSTDHTLRGKPASALGTGTLDASSPVQWVLETGRTRGRFVAERSDTVIAAEVRRAFLTQSALVVLALLLLYGALIPVFRKVTAELEARNRRLVESEGRYRTLMEQASDAIFVADPKGRLTEVNAHAIELLGYTREELLQRHAMDIMSIEDVSQLPLHMADLEAGKTILVERPVRRKDGTFLTGDVSAKILEDGRLMTSIRDVSERKQLREAQKLEAVGRFASGIADDFSELVDTIARHADNLAPARERSRRRRDPLAARSDALPHLAAARGRQSQELHPELLDLNDLLGSRLALLHDLAGSRVEVVFSPGDDVERVYADPHSSSRWSSTSCSTRIRRCPTVARSPSRRRASSSPTTLGVTGQWAATRCSRSATPAVRRVTRAASASASASRPSTASCTRAAARSASRPTPAAARPCGSTCRSPKC